MDEPRREEDQAVFAQLREHGADLGKPTEFICFVYWDGTDTVTGEQAKRAAAEATADGWTAAAHLDEPDGWSVKAERTMVPNSENIDAMSDFMTEVAGKYDGEYDGWEAAITK